MTQDLATSDSAEITMDSITKTNQRPAQWSRTEITTNTARNATIVDRDRKQNYMQLKIENLQWPKLNKTATNLENHVQ